MKKIVFQVCLALVFLLVPGIGRGDVSVDSTTIVRFGQKDRPGFPKENVAPATEFLGVDAEKLGDGNLSLHLYGWGRVDLKEKSYNDKGADGSLTYGYVQYRFNHANARIRAGRVFVMEGMVNEQVDGVSVRTDLPFGFGVSAFGGATVHTVSLPGENTDGKGDWISGGRINFRYGGMVEVGVSGVYEDNVPTLVNGGNQVLVPAGSFGDRRLVGGDVWLSPHRAVEVMGRTVYNTETDRVAEHSYLLHIKPASDLVLTGEYSSYRERSLFFSSVMFARMVRSLDERSNILGGRASYRLTDQVELIGDYRYYSRDLGEAARFGGEVRFTFLENTVRSGIGYHYLRSGPDFAVIPTATGSGSFHEVRAYVLRDGKRYFASVDGIGYKFREKISSKDVAWEVVGSLGWKISSGLTLSGDISYGRNPQFDDEVRGLLRLTWNADIAKGGRK